MPDVRTAFALTSWTASLPRAMLAALLIGCASAPLALLVPIPLLAAAAVALAVIVAVSLHPPLAAYLLITFTPLLAGLQRSSLIPLLRPHELLAVLVGAGLVVNGVGRLLSGQMRRPRVRAMDSAIVFMAFTASVLPLLWLLARGQALTADDVLYALTFWKFYAIFLIVRLAVSEARHVRLCLVLSMATGCIVAVVAGLQALQLFGVDQLVNQIYPPEDPSGATAGRGSSTLDSSAAVGDIMAYNLAIALAFLLHEPQRPRTLVLLAGVFFLGGLASGQFSGAIAVAVSITTVAALTGRLRQVGLIVLPASLLAAVLLRPVISARLRGFESTTGLPQSWESRLINLRTYFWPELFSDHSYLLGVRPAARIAAPESWRDYVYIESGYTWLLWVGGLPLLIAYVIFVVVAMRQAVQLARRYGDERSVAGIAAAAALACTVVLMAIDPHLVLRGAADLLFALLALTAASQAHQGNPAVPAPVNETGPPIAESDGSEAGIRRGSEDR
jgi:hypothetical protein